ncbi:MAG TPA: methylmalonyl-CoA mutase family protein [Thermoanaerobaculia bacterium]|nr:methylmalonyl-CoA mutase family protein [Thermoanaerobaculia bacterium]
MPLPRLAPASGAWRTWQELPISAGAAGRAALARERGRGLGGIWLRYNDADATVSDVAQLLADSLGDGDVELAAEWAGDSTAGGVLVAAAMGIGLAPERLRGCLGCDPLGALARGASVSGSAYVQVAAAARWAAAHAPAMRAALVSTAPYADAGADAVQEIAFALATGAETLRWLLEDGFTPADAAAQVLVSTTVGRDLYLQVAKLRALRLTWRMLLASVDAPPSALRLHARTAWRTKGRRDPGTDLVRATVETFAAVLGGCDDVTTSPLLDAEEELALGMPLGSATQLLLREEVGLDRVADAVVGSWYVESLTAALARRAWEAFEGIERRGGMTRELTVGAVAQQVAAAAERRRRALLEGDLPIVGVTLHWAKQAMPLPHRPLVVEPDADPPLRHPTDVPFAGDTLFALAVNAAECGATLGELARTAPAHPPALRAPALVPWRDAELFEAAEVSA